LHTTESIKIEPIKQEIPETTKVVEQQPLPLPAQFPELSISSQPLTETKPSTTETIFPKEFIHTEIVLPEGIIKPQILAQSKLQDNLQRIKREEFIENTGGDSSTAPGSEVSSPRSIASSADSEKINILQHELEQKNIMIEYMQDQLKQIKEQNEKLVHRLLEFDQQQNATTKVNDEVERLRREYFFSLSVALKLNQSLKTSKAISFDTQAAFEEVTTLNIKTQDWQNWIYKQLNK